MGWGQCWGFSRSTIGVPLSPTPSNAALRDLGQRGCAAWPGVGRQRGVGCQGNGAVAWQLTAACECGWQPAAFYSTPGFTPLAPARASAPWQLPSHHVPELSLAGFCALLDVQDAISILPCLPCPEHRLLPLPAPRFPLVNRVSQENLGKASQRLQFPSKFWGTSPSLQDAQQRDKSWCDI